MKRILKYDIPIATTFELQLHENFQVLNLAVVNEKAYIWIMMDESKPFVSVPFRVALTGQSIEIMPWEVYIGTFIIGNGGFVGHLFMDIEN